MYLEKLPLSSTDYGLKRCVTVLSSSVNYADIGLVWSAGLLKTLWEQENCS